MNYIRKVDYFVGVFVSSILQSTTGVPALFDETNNSKRVTFMTDLGNFNVYIKYATTLSNKKHRIDGKLKNKMSCNISFNKNDYNILKNNFVLADHQNYIVLVCANKNLDKTRIVVLPYYDAMKCLKYKEDSGARIITVTKTGSEQSFKCYGVRGREFPKGCYVSSYLNHMKYFDRDAKDEYQY